MGVLENDRKVEVCFCVYVVAVVIDKSFLGAACSTVLENVGEVELIFVFFLLLSLW